MGDILEFIFESIGSLVQWSKKKIWHLIITLTTCAVVISMLLLLISLEWIDVGYFGFDYDGVGGEIDLNRVYGCGVHQIGIGHSFVTYPTFPQFLDYSTDSTAIECRTEDKVSTTVKAKVFYSLTSSALPTIFERHLKTYNALFSLVFEDAIRDAVSNVTLEDLYLRFSTTHAAMKASIQSEVDAFDVMLFDFQIIDFDIPDEIVESITDVQVAREQINQAGYAQEVETVAAATRIVEAEAQANITIIQATATAAETVASANATANSFFVTMQTRVNVTRDAVAAYGFTSTEQTLSYLKNNVYEDWDSSNVVWRMKQLGSSL